MFEIAREFKRFDSHASWPSLTAASPGRPARFDARHLCRWH